MARFRGKNLDHYAKVDKIRKQSRKKTHAGDLAEDFAKPYDTWGALGFSDWFPARVVEVHKRYCFVSSEPEPGVVNTRDVWLATMPRKFLVAARGERNFVAVGDRVLCTPTLDKPDPSQDLPACVIQHMAPRQSRIARLDPHTKTRLHVLAANADQLLIVASFLKPKVKWGLIDRYLVLAEAEHIKPILVLNKADLLVEEGKTTLQEEADEMVGLYRGLGYDVFAVQANADEADKSPEIVALREMLKGRITLLSGHSGVGKSSLVNLFDPEINQEVEPDDDIFYKGRHTTTYASFIKLGTGGFVIDTPGVRSFTFPDMSAIDLTGAFVEMKPFLGKCKYRECRHIDEPECAIRAEVEAGRITEWRYKSYLGILLGASGREGRMREVEI